MKTCTINLKSTGTSVSELSCVFGSAVLGTLAGWILSVLYIFLLTQILNWTNHTQSWYRSSFYLFTLYYCSTTFFCVLGSFLFFHQKVCSIHHAYMYAYMCCTFKRDLFLHIVFDFQSKFSSFQQSQFHSLAIQLIWTTCLLLATLVGVRSSFIFLFVVLAPTCGNIALMFCGLSECSSKYSDHSKVFFCILIEDIHNLLVSYTLVCSRYVGEDSITAGNHPFVNGNL